MNIIVKMGLKIGGECVMSKIDRLSFGHLPANFPFKFNSWLNCSVFDTHDMYCNIYTLHYYTCGILTGRTH